MQRTILLSSYLRRTSGVGSATMVLLDRHNGVCRSWIAAKGYGFITDAATNKDIFVYFNSLSCRKPRKMLSIGEECEYDCETSDGRTRAVQVTAPGGEPLMGGDIDPSMMPRSTEGRHIKRKSSNE